MIRALFAGLVLATFAAGSALADEIVLKKEFGGDKIKCQIYKETDDYINYIDLKTDQDAGCARSIVEKVTKSDAPLIDVEAWFLKKAADSKDKDAAEAARAKAEEYRKAQEAAKKAAEGKKTGKLTMRPLNENSGVKQVPSAGGNAELIVDPFPEEDANPPKPPAGKSEKPPVKKK